MKRIKTDEAYQNLRQFLHSRGIEFKEGTCTRTIRRGCPFLSDAISMTQAAVERASAEVDANLKRIRQTLHAKTTSVPPKAPAPVSTPPATATAAQAEEAPPAPKKRPRRAKRSPIRRTTRRPSTS